MPARGKHFITNNPDARPKIPDAGPAFDNARTAAWDGIRNHQANNNMKDMKTGDRIFFYHSVVEKQVVGIVEVIKECYPDPADATAKL